MSAARTRAGPGLHASIVVDRGAFRLDVELTIAPGEVLALIGPNGAGKTTALRALAGLVPLTAGVVDLDGQRLDEPSTGTYVATERRPIAMVFQDYLLFPHLSALDNVAFGLRSRGSRRHDARLQAREWLVRVGLDGQRHARPSALSGGQAQRVALARALVTSPRLLLLDEPLAALDASTRMEVRSDLRRHLADYGGTTVLVTHDPLDAMILAQRLVVVESGRVVQVGTPADVARAPRTAYVARLLGLNLYRGSAAGTTVTLLGGGTLSIVAPAVGEVFVAFPPSAVALHAERPTGSPHNTWPVTVVGLEQHATTVRVELAGEPAVLADVTAAAVAELDLVPGRSVWAAVQATDMHSYPA